MYNDFWNTCNFTYGIVTSRVHPELAITQRCIMAKSKKQKAAEAVVEEPTNAKEAVEAAIPTRKYPACRCCGKADNGVKYLVLNDGDPIRQESGEWSKFHGGCAHTVKKTAPEGAKVQVISAFAFRKQKAGGSMSNENVEQLAAGVWKTIGRGDKSTPTAFAVAFEKAKAGKVAK